MFNCRFLQRSQVRAAAAPAHGAQADLPGQGEAGDHVSAGGDQPLRQGGHCDCRWHPWTSVWSHQHVGSFWWTSTQTQIHLQWRLRGSRTVGHWGALYSSRYRVFIIIERQEIMDIFRLLPLLSRQCLVAAWESRGGHHQQPLRVQRWGDGEVRHGYVHGDPGPLQTLSSGRHGWWEGVCVSRRHRLRPLQSGWPEVTGGQAQAGLNVGGAWWPPVVRPWARGRDLGQPPGRVSGLGPGCHPELPVHQQPRADHQESRVRHDGAHQVSRVRQINMDCLQGLVNQLKDISVLQWLKAWLMTRHW